MNLRKGPGTSYSKIRQLNKPESYVVWAEKDGWLNLGDEQWVKNDPSYVKFSKKSTVDSSIVGKRVVSKLIIYDFMMLHLGGIKMLLDL